MHLESLIEDLGGFGWYQGILLILIAMTKVTLASSMLMMAFAGVDPGWWCVSSDDSTESTFLTTQNSSYKNCNWNQTCFRRFDDRMVTIVTEWDLTCDMKWISNTIISIQMAGVFIGSILAGHIADGYGRKIVHFFSVLLGVVGNVVAAFSVNWIMFTVLRVILGMAVGMMISVNYLYIVEFVGRRYRSLIASVPSWGIGVVVFAGLIWGIPHWKWLHLAAAAISFPFLFGWFFVPESLRWLAAKGRLKEARNVIKAMAKYNKKPVPDTTVLELIAAEEKALGDKAKNYSYLDLFRTRSLVKRTILTCYIWFSLSVVYYAISFGVKKLSGDFFVNMMIMAVLELPVMPAVLIVTSIFGRRWSCASLFFLASMSCIGVAVANSVAPPDLKGTLENVFALLSKFLVITAWHIVQALSSEQYPTVIRNLAYAAQSTTARVGGILAGQVLSLGGKDDLMAPFIAMGVLIFLNGVACFFLRETKGKALEDTMATELIVKPKDIVEEIKVENGTFFAPNETEVVVEHACVNVIPDKETNIEETDTDSADQGVYMKLLNYNENGETEGYNDNSKYDEDGIKIGGNDGTAIKDSDNDGAAIKDSDNHEVAIKDSDNDRAAIKDSDNDGAAIKDSDNDGAAIKDSDNDEVAIKDSDNDRAAINDSDNNGAAIKIGDNDGAPIKDSNNHEVAIKDSDNDGVAIKIGDNDEVAINDSDNDGAAIKDGDNDQAAIKIGDNDEYDIKGGDNDEVAIVDSDNIEVAIKDSDNDGAAIKDGDNDQAAIKIGDNVGHDIKDGDNDEDINDGEEDVWTNEMTQNGFRYTKLTEENEKDVNDKAKDQEPKDNVTEYSKRE